MLSSYRTPLLAALVTISVAACGSGSGHYDSAAGVSALPGDNATSGMVFSGRGMYEYGGTLLTYLYTHVSGMVVDDSTYPCPSIQLRGRKSMFGSTDPVVYVDGARAANTCVLDDLLTRDLNRVEIYPMGVANQPGYQAHPNGLILVFLLDGPVPGEFRPSGSTVASAERTD